MGGNWMFDEIKKINQRMVCKNTKTIAEQAEKSSINLVGAIGQDS